MLTTLRIKNLALVDELTLELSPGYNVITGETGAGKSILIGALELLLGARADRTLLRSGSDSCTVEAVFDLSHLPRLRRLPAPAAADVPAPAAADEGEADDISSLLEACGLEPCENHQLVLKRTFTAQGANRQFVNGSPATLAALERVGDRLVDIHGPHAHQSLLHPARQLAMLDAFGGLEAARDAFAQGLRRRSALLAQKTALVTDERAYAQQLDLLRFQVQEITSANLRPDEEEELIQAHRQASNAARLLELSQAAIEALAEHETSLLTRAGALGRILQELRRLDAGTTPLLALHEQAVAALRDLQTALSQYADCVDMDPARLQELEERLNLVQSLKRKYGATVAEVLAFGQQARERLERLERRQEELASLNAQLEQCNAELWERGLALSARRRRLLPRFCRAVGSHLADLGFSQSRFDVTMNTLSATEWAALANPAASGLDTVEFQFAPNPGEPARPLRAIASSGELARVMLALKTVLAEQDDIPVLIFDEVDANIGGETAHKVGAKLRQVAARHQVLCITHLPQVAAPAAAHYVVAKRLQAGRTVSEVTRLDKAGRVGELARMLGGGGEAARRHAEALLRQAADRGRSDRFGG